MSDDKTDFSVFEYIEERATNIKNYSDRLRQALRNLSEWFSNLNIGIEVVDDIALKNIIVSSDDPKENYFLVANNYAIFAAGLRYGDVDFYRKPYIGGFENVWNIENMSRACLVNVVKQLPRFLKKIASRASELEDKLLPVAEIAEAMLKATSSE